MMEQIEFLRVSPNTSIQDAGRPDALSFGLSASGPMDKGAFLKAQNLLLGEAVAIEFGMLGIDFRYSGNPMQMAFAGGAFMLTHNGTPKTFPGTVKLCDGDEVHISTGPWGVYGYLMFAGEMNIPKILNSRATNLAASIGGIKGRALLAGDVLSFTETSAQKSTKIIEPVDEQPDFSTPIRVLPGLHANLLGVKFWQALFEKPFQISSLMDRMGVRLTDQHNRFDMSGFKSIVSDAVVPGDIQILGDGTPVVLMRDHQPVGGYPRIATIIQADQNRFAQMRPNTEISFSSVGLKTAQKLRTKP